MTDIRQWIEGLGLGQYADVFVAEEITLADLPNLTDAMLKDLGLPMGPRSRVLAAADHLPKNALAELPATNETASKTPASENEEAIAERRQLTVMFCDLVGSTELSSKLDPEDMREVMASYQRAAAGVIERLDGYVAQYLGDGLMTYFGWPRAHEDDAQRAVHAGLEIIESVNTLDAPVRLSIRIGIATGAVVVGDSRGDNRDDARLAVGETPNLAARIQGVAPVDSVAIANSTRRLIGGAFELQALGVQMLKGIDNDTVVYRVVGEASTESRFEAAQDAVLTPLVGRENEIAMLIERWEQAKDREGQVVVLTGEAGIGKSRVTQALRERLTDEPHIRLRYQCSPYYTNTAFYPAIAQLERAAGFVQDDSIETKLDKLEALRGQGVAETPLFAALLSLPIDRYPALSLSPQKQKENTIAALASQVATLASNQPVLMIFEDAHWVDPTTLETITAVIEKVRDNRVLLVITARPEFESPWAGHTHVTALVLGRLARKLGANLVGKVTGGKGLPEEVLTQIVEKTDGIPLFVEELTKTVIEAGFLTEHDDRYTLDGPLPPLAIPSTLRDSLMARLDRLSPVKEVAQTGACIGREFSYQLLASVSPLGDNELQDALRKLVSSELIFGRGGGQDASYIFKHALVQDTAYESMLRSHRQRLHKAIADKLPSVYPSVLENEPELVARHLTEAGLYEAGAKQWLKAGHRSLNESALAEAAEQLKRGLDAAMSLSESPERDRLELDLRYALGTTMMAYVGWPHHSVAEALIPAWELCQRLNDDQVSHSVLWGLWLHTATRGDLKEAVPWLERMQDLARRSGNDEFALVSDMAAVCNFFWLGDFPQTRIHRERILSRYELDKHRHIVDSTIHDPKVIAHHWGGSAMDWILGKPGSALSEFEAEIEHARVLGHPFNLAFALTSGALALVLLRDAARHFDGVQEAEQIADEQSIPFITHSLVPMWRSFAELEKGHLEDALASITASLTVLKSAGGVLITPFLVSYRALMLARSGDPKNALDNIKAVVADASRRGERWCLAEAHRIFGEIWLAQTEPQRSEAEACFQQALEVARSQDAHGWELRAATSLARLWQLQGKRKQAYELLSASYEWFTEGFDTPDLRDAKALLAELGA